MFNFLPKDEKFYDELEALSQHVVSASGELKGVVEKFPQVDGMLGTIENDRVAARKIYQESLLRLDQAFITPIDREDILNLMTEMYGVIDRIAELSQRFRLYRVKELFPTLKGQSENLKAMADELDAVVGGLRRQEKMGDLKPRLDSVGNIMERVKCDREAFLGTLFEQSDPLDIFKKKELHDLMEEAIERCEEATETLERVLLKNG